MIAASLFLKPQSIEGKRYLIAPPPHLEFFHFGYNEVIADSLWVRAIQDFDYCESQIAQNLCVGNSWLFQMLDSITNLSPHFRVVYATGTLTLSVLISDIEGASKLFDKAVRAFPTDGPILYRAAYHALYEEKNNEKAADLAVRAAQYGGPAWLYSLATRLYTEAGQKELGERLYQDLKAKGEDESLLKRMRDKLGIQEP